MSSDVEKEFIEKARSPFSEAFEMFRKNHAAVAGLIVLIFIVLAGIFGPYVYPGDPFEMVWAPFSPPGDEGYFLGTDYLGRDLASMLIHGARVSIAIGLSAAFLTVFIGITLGALAGFYGGMIDNVPAFMADDRSGETLVLLSKRYRKPLPQFARRTYAQPSAPILMDKFDYANPEALQEVFELGAADGRAFGGKMTARGKMAARSSSKPACG